MYFQDAQDPDEVDDHYAYSDYNPVPANSCSQGHRSSLCLQTQQGGAVCLLCLANLISDPLSPTLHVSYALSQLSQALSQPPFLNSLLTFHSHFLVSPLVFALSSFDDESLARQVIDLVVRLCSASDDGDGLLCGDFIARVSDRLSSGSLAWSRRQVYMLHCFGVLLNCQTKNPYAQIKNKDGLVSNLVAGLQLPSEEIRGEILFVLYKLSLIQYASNNGDGTDVLYAFCPELLHLSVEALMKTQNDDVRLNCVAFLSVLTQRGFLGNACANDEMVKEVRSDDPPLNILFAEAIKGPLLSSDRQVQMSTLGLVINYLSWEGTTIQEIQLLVDESIADYVFEIIRLSEGEDPIIKSCVLVLDLLSRAEQSFNQKLAIGFATLIPVLRHVAEIPFHPVQTQTLKLILKCISECPGIVSTSCIDELALVLMGLFKSHSDGEVVMLPDTFTMACSIFVAIIKSPSSHGISNLTLAVREVSEHAVLSRLSIFQGHSNQLLHFLYLLKEAYAYGHGKNSNSCCEELQNCILAVCTKHLLPWLLVTIDKIDEELVLGILETFHLILIQDSGVKNIEFVNALVSSSWFSFSFGCLGLFPTEKMKLRVYLMLSSLVDVILGNDSGQSIKDSVSFLPADPADLLFLLSQKSSQNLELSSCQSAIVLILYTSSLHDDRLADEKLILASLEQYIIVSSGDLLCRSPDPLTVTRLVNLYSFYRSLANMSCQIPYSPEAERIMFQLMTQSEWDLPSLRIHLASLKWLFQQEKIRKPLSNQILKFCRTITSQGIYTVVHDQFVNAQTIAELAAAGDNYGAMLLVCLLKQLIAEEGAEHDIISVANLLTAIINIIPSASDQLCLQGLGNAIRTLYYYSSQAYSNQTFTTISLLVFRILSNVRPEILSHDDSWLAVVVKLIDSFIPKDAQDEWSPDSLFIIAILSLILHHSTWLVEASKSILFNTSLASTINSAIQEACSRGSSLVDDDERTNSGEMLIFVLLLSYFSMRSLDAVLPGIVDWQDLFDQQNGTQIPVIAIRCHDLCRLMHFGSPIVKLVASHCLLELFTRLSDQRSKKQEELRCTPGYLMSVMAVLEGLVFYGDPRVATNCGLCLSMIFELQNLDLQQARVIERDKWCRIILEELAVSMAVPCLASNSLINYKSAIHVAIASLKFPKAFGWIKLVLDDACISAIIKNLSANNLNAEIISLFRELLNSKLLKADQITSLSRILQVCQKRAYTETFSQDTQTDEPIEKVVSVENDLGEVCQYLIQLMLSEPSSVDMDSRGSDAGRKRLLEEIEMFFRTLAENENS